jgi:aryl-alcohol dehydrogenase-like predicted oxidoreductase
MIALVDEATAATGRTTMLGRSGVRVSRIGVGAMTWGDPSGLSRLSPAKLAYGGARGIDEERRAMEASVAAGVTFFDTAAMYSGGAAERRLGEVAAGHAVQLATKFPASMSLSRLGRTTVDLYLHHYPTGRVSIPRLMELMADGVAAGKLRAVGVSNYSVDQIRTAHAALAERGIPLAAVQQGYSLLDRRVETNGVLDTCRELGITLIAYQPLASGALTGTYTVGRRPSGLRRFMRSFRGAGREAVVPVVQVLREIGGRHDRTPAHIALRWLIEQDDVVPIPGAKDGVQAAANGQSMTFRLTTDEIDAIERATRAWRG